MIINFSRSMFCLPLAFWGRALLGCGYKWYENEEVKNGETLSGTYHKNYILTDMLWFREERRRVIHSRGKCFDWYDDIYLCTIWNAPRRFFSVENESEIMTLLRCLRHKFQCDIRRECQVSIKFVKVTMTSKARILSTFLLHEFYSHVINDWWSDGRRRYESSWTFWFSSWIVNYSFNRSFSFSLSAKRFVASIKEVNVQKSLRDCRGVESNAVISFTPPWTC